MYAVTQILVDLVVEICGGEGGLQRITKEVAITTSPCIKSAIVI